MVRFGDPTGLYLDDQGPDDWDELFDEMDKSWKNFQCKKMCDEEYKENVDRFDKELERYLKTSPSYDRVMNALGLYDNSMMQANDELDKCKKKCDDDQNRPPKPAPVPVPSGAILPEQERELEESFRDIFRPGLEREPIITPGETWEGIARGARRVWDFIKPTPTPTPWDQAVPPPSIYRPLMPIPFFPLDTLPLPSPGVLPGFGLPCPPLPVF